MDQQLLTGADAERVTENCPAVGTGTGKAAAASQLALGDWHL